MIPLGSCQEEGGGSTSPVGAISSVLGLIFWSTVCIGCSFLCRHLLRNNRRSRPQTVVMQPQGQAAEYNYTTQPANYIVSQVNMPQQYPGQPLLLSQLIHHLLEPFQVFWD